MLFVGTSMIHHSAAGVFILCNIWYLLIYSYKDTTCDWIEVISHSENANIMAPYVQLYFLLKEEADLLIKYKEEVDKLVIEKNT